VLLALPAMRGDDKPKDEDKPKTPKEQYQALVKEYSSQQQAIIAKYRKLKGEEQQKVLQKYFGLGKEFADKFYKLAEDNSKDPAATEALFWVLQNGSGSPVHEKAVEKVTALMEEMPLKDLVQRLRMLRGGSPKLMEIVFKRAEKEEKDMLAGDLLAWIATSGEATSIGQKAMDRLIDKYIDHAAIAQVCQTLGYRTSAKGAETLKRILEKSPKDSVKAAAALSLGRNLSAETDKLGDKIAEADKVAAEAEKYFVMVIDQFAKDNATQKKEAERELKALRTVRVGKDAPIITAPDLDEKEFKLSDYRGKVVLLDFWGHW
jgi:hypothetical protein